MTDMNRLKRPVIFSGILVLTLLLGATRAFASPITITFDVNPAVSFQQTTNKPCVIGNASCSQPPGMIYTAYAATPLTQGDTYNSYSPSYDYAALVGFLSNQTAFRVGIDENFATGAGNEVLVEFTVWGCNTSSFACGSYTGRQLDNAATVLGDKDATLIAANYTELYKTSTPYTLDTHNGNGYSDALSSLISINGLTNDRFVFEAIIQNDTDGMEQFFLIPAGTPPDPLPEPGSMVLLGTGLVGLVSRLRKRA